MVDCDLATLQTREPKALRNLVNKHLFVKDAIMQGVTEAIKALHTRGWAHNNIRPEHVLVTLNRPYQQPPGVNTYWPVLTSYKACAPFGRPVEFIDSDGIPKRLTSDMSDYEGLELVGACVERILMNLWYR
ncbi:hypothetical protein QBC46DRAFT_419263 [Diplogelasinospora grovesii]|uniref:Protein kinase domain-containing protein n=1 Tax=Diplogelasinospora grovesii TaxID=303347 RepID=A0AAN6S1F4_9PEZI|nr:hypothetical protein QBC46DRAFT_419263 [Diplogelasinospora grovesii]